MAYCPQCKNSIDPQQMSTHVIECLECHLELKFKKDEYKRIVRPGIYILSLFIFNMFFTNQPSKRLILNVMILFLWFAFYWRYKNYLKSAYLEKVIED